MTTITVRSHERAKPAKKPDPFAEVMNAKRAIFARRYGIELVDHTDERLNRPAEYVPGPGRMTLQQIAEQLKGLARMAKKIGGA